MMASAMVGSPSHGCQALVGSWLVISVERAAHPVVQQLQQVLTLCSRDGRDGQVIEHQHVQPRQLGQPPAEAAVAVGRLQLLQQPCGAGVGAR